MRNSHTKFLTKIIEQKHQSLLKKIAAAQPPPMRPLKRRGARHEGWLRQQGDPSFFKKKNIFARAGGRPSSLAPRALSTLKRKVNFN
jgi:hypothetical protein